MFAILRGGTGRRKQSINRVLSAEKRVFRGEMCPEKNLYALPADNAYRSVVDVSRAG